ncbi:MAG: hypothetical protein E7552_06555 [Ruminococcaceae bacterium]|nr:hypothetical protein [Oscillospiraceae bacterium]
MTALYTVLRSMVIASAAGSVAALLLWGLLFCVRRVSLRCQYGLWVATSALFLLPVRFRQQVPVDIRPFQTVTVYITETATRPLPPPTAAVPQLAWGDVAALVWFAVALCLLAYYTVSYAVAVRRLRRTTHAAACPLLAEYTKRRVRVRVGASVTSPLLLGVFRPTLYLPDRSFDEQQLRHILAHETTHLHRGDLWVKRLCLAVRCVHWFNPVAYLAVNRVATVCETSCDTAAVAQCGGDTAAYLGTVLSLLCESRTTPLTTAMAESLRRVKARFRTVSEHRPRRAATVCAVVMATVLLVGALCAGGVYAGLDKAPREIPRPTLPPSPTVTVESESSPSAVTAESAVPTSAWCWPAPTTRDISSSYGYRWGDLHRGIDIAAAVGDPVVATGSGRVAVCEGRGYNGGYGVTVVIEHGNGVQTLYAHLDSVAVALGDTVTAGQTIAAAGMTGKVTGPCLHFEVQVKGETVDPLAWLNGVGVTE